jgi:hypothetical protein
MSGSKCDDALLNSLKALGHGSHENECVPIMLVKQTVVASHGTTVGHGHSHVVVQHLFLFVPKALASLFVCSKGSLP